MQPTNLRSPEPFTAIMKGLPVIPALLAVPWLEPFAPGPSANVVPWLASAACLLLALLLVQAHGVGRKVWIPALLVVLFVVLRPAPGATDRAALAGATVLVLLAFAIGRGKVAGRAATPLLAHAWLAAALLSSLLALFQYFDLAAFLHPWAYAAQAGEAVGNLRQRNQLASLTSIGLAALLWVAARAGDRARMALCLLAAAVLAAANAATTSRTGLLEWVVVFALVLVWRGPAQRRRVLLCAAGLASYGVAIVVLPLLLTHFTGATPDTLFGRLGADLGCSSRRVLWDNVLRLVAEHPWRGWGWGELDYAHYLHLYGDAPRFCDILDNAHNLPLHVAVELGVPAALLLCGLVAWAVLRARPWRETDAGRQLAWCVLAVIGLHSLLEYPLWYGPFQLALGLALGLLAPRAPAATALGARARAGIATIGLVLVAYAAWDYDRVSQLYLEPESRRSFWREDTLAHARRSWLFAGQARFAELTLAPLTRGNAEWVYATAQEMLHYSPEPRVIERVIESATMLGRLDEAVLHLARYRAAFPEDYAKWRAAQK